MIALQSASIQPACIPRSEGVLACAINLIPADSVGTLRTSRSFLSHYLPQPFLTGDFLIIAVPARAQYQHLRIQEGLHIAY
jgi:hypothetical protein